MKNIIKCNTTQHCYSCNKQGFFTRSAYGQECPLCGCGDYLSSIHHEDNIADFDIEIYYNDLYFCPKCKILFSDGCLHHELNVESTMNAHIIAKWEYKGEIYDGMPCFESIEEWVSEIKNIKVLEMVCPNKGLMCGNKHIGQNVCILCVD